MKIIAVPFMLILLLFTSCGDGTNANSSSRFLPSSMGGFDQLIIVIDDELMKTDVGDSIKAHFEVGYEILYRYESLMDVSYIEVSSFKNFITRTRNVLFIGTNDGNDATSAFIRSSLGEENLQKISSQPDKPYQFRKDVWARNQLVGFLITEDKESLKTAVANHSSAWMQAYLKSDLGEYKQFTYISGVNKALKKQLKEYYQFEIDIPIDYKLAQNDKGFIWLRKDDPLTTVNLLIDVEPADPNKKPFSNRGIFKRNKLGSIYVSSEMPGSYMSTDSTLGFIHKYSIVDNHPRYENRGLWRMEKDFKGGPFLNYYIHDTKNQQYIFLEGFVYGPTESKKPLMRQIETIFSTFKIL